MERKQDPVKNLLRQANRTLEGPLICDCGNCRQAVLQAEEILKTTPHGDCALWMLIVSGAIFARAANVLQLSGWTPDEIRSALVNATLMANNYGAGYAGGMAHFDQDRRLKPKKGPI